MESEYLIVVADTVGKSKNLLDCMNGIANHFHPFQSGDIVVIKNSRVKFDNTFNAFIVNEDEIITKENKYIFVDKYLKSEHFYSGKYDYIFYFDSNAFIKKNIDPEDFLGDLTVIRHPGCIHLPNHEYEYERNSNSAAYIEPGRGKHYIFDIFLGGKTSYFIEIVRLICEYKERDAHNGIVPRWGDESYLNKILLERPQYRDLPESFVFFPGSTTNRNSCLIEFGCRGRISDDPRHDMTDTTFIIPVSVDFLERKQNLCLLVDYLNTHLNTNIIVCEFDLQTKLNEIKNRCTHVFLKKNNNFFHKTKVFNNMINMVSTEFIVSHDCDVFCDYVFYIKSIDRIRNGEYAAMYPFNENYTIDRSAYPLLKNTMDVKNLPVNKAIKAMTLAPGGIFITKKDTYIAAGMENENFKSWGPEDAERLHRFNVLGYRVGRESGKLFHLNHPVGIDSGEQNPFFNANCQEYEKVKTMNKNQLLQYMKSWSWLNEKK